MRKRRIESRTLKVATGWLTNDHIKVEILGGTLTVNQEIHISESLGGSSEEARGLKSWEARIFLSREDRDALVGQDDELKLECLEAETQRKLDGKVNLKPVQIKSNDRDIVEIELEIGTLDEEDA